jgi:lysophospholipase L1-like esterase
MSLRRAMASWVSILSVSVAVTVVALLVANAIAGAWLRRNPEFLMSREQRVHENTRAVREQMISPARAVLWYDLRSADEVKPMWDEAYRAGARFESYVHFGPRPLVGNYYGATEQGYRMVRDGGPWPPSPKNYNVFFFGGSTSFGVGPYWATAASYLQEAMNRGSPSGRPARVYNFGRSGYMSTQELILFQSLLRAGHRPDAVVFLDGLNDFCFSDGQPSGWQSLAAFFNETNERYQREAAGHGVITRWHYFGDFVRTMPLMRLTHAAADRMLAEPVPQYVPPTVQQPDQPEPEETLKRVIARYQENVKQAKAIAEASGIDAFFVWQPIPTYNYDLKHHVFNPDRLGCHVNSKVGYPMMRASGVPQALGKRFIWAADMQKDLAEPLYVDAFHYTAPMSRRLADFIHASMRAQGLKRTAAP